MSRQPVRASGAVRQLNGAMQQHAEILIFRSESALFRSARVCHRSGAVSCNHESVRECFGRVPQCAERVKELSHTSKQTGTRLSEVAPIFKGQAPPFIMPAQSAFDGIVRIMAELWDRIRDAIHQDRYVIGVHAAIRLRERRIPIWQGVACSLEGRLLTERPKAKLNPAVEIDIILADGTSAKAVWSWLAEDSTAKLVTVHFYDR